MIYFIKKIVVFTKKFHLRLLFENGSCDSKMYILFVLFYRMGKRRASHHSTEHEQEDQVNEWANMTGKKHKIQISRLNYTKLRIL